MAHIDRILQILRMRLARANADPLVSQEARTRLAAILADAEQRYARITGEATT
jgi:hypothetical protein